MIWNDKIEIGRTASGEAVYATKEGVRTLGDLIRGERPPASFEGQAESWRLTALAKDETITWLRAQVAEKDAVIATLTPRPVKFRGT